MYQMSNEKEKALLEQARGYGYALHKYYTYQGAFIYEFLDCYNRHHYNVNCDPLNWWPTLAMTMTMIDNNKA